MTISLTFTQSDGTPVGGVEGEVDQIAVLSFDDMAPDPEQDGGVVFDPGSVSFTVTAIDTGTGRVQEKTYSFAHIRMSSPLAQELWALLDPIYGT